MVKILFIYLKSFQLYQICNKAIESSNVASDYFLRRKVHLKNAVINQCKNVSKITGTNRMLFLTGLLILKLYYFM